LPHVVPQVERCLAFIAGSAPVLVEVGFDHGRRLHSMARLNPGWRVLGLEVRKRRVAEARARAERDGLTNVLPWRMDARTVFAGVLPPASVDVVDVLFPTPWWSAALRRERSLVDEAFVADVARVLRPGGHLHAATDVGWLGEALTTTLTSCPNLSPIAWEDARTRRPACGQRSRRQWTCDEGGVPWTRQVWCRE
jgi:tRNA (guanine-N7-)-methyltransferase